MGQAKLRGTFEERREAAIIKAGLDREERLKLDLERGSCMTEEERQRQRDGAIWLAQLMAMAGAYMPYSVRRNK